VEARREVDGARAFFDAEKDELLKKVAGAAQFAAKSKGCDMDVSGAVSHALKDTVEKRLVKRLREQSEAHVFIDRNQTALGKENVEKLLEQADEIAHASYLARVLIVEHKVRPAPDDRGGRDNQGHPRLGPPRRAGLSGRERPPPPPRRRRVKSAPRPCGSPRPRSTPP
jgi:hypothetical protein